MNCLFCALTCLYVNHVNKSCIIIIIIIIIIIFYCVFNNAFSGYLHLFCSFNEAKIKTKLYLQVVWIYFYLAHQLFKFQCARPLPLSFTHAVLCLAKPRIPTE